MPSDAAPSFSLSPECLAAGTATPIAERIGRRNGLILAALILLAGAIVAAALSGTPAAAIACLAGAGTLAWWRARWRKPVLRRRRQLWSQPFPEKYDAFLLAKIPQYRCLDEAGRELFRQRAKVFLDEVVFHGAGVEVDDGLRLRACAAAVVPTLGFPEWSWPALREIIFRPEGYAEGSLVGEGGVVTEFEESGMIGRAGVLGGVMMLSSEDLIWEFAHPEYGANVGFHEFAHLMAGDGGVLLAERDRAGWKKLLRSERQLITRGESLMDEYALVSEDELFAVASELFFTVPYQFRLWHRKLYAVMTRAYRQDTCRWLEDRGPLPDAPRRRRRNKATGRNRV